MKSSFRLRGTPLAIGAVLAFAGLAGAQGLTADSPQPTLVTPIPTDSYGISSLLAAARSGDSARVRAVLDASADPLTRRIALWALADAMPDAMTWDQADEARRTLAEWPRPQRRQAAAEKLIDRSPLTSQGVIAWFGKDDPITAQGAMALATALRQTGQVDAATEVIRHAWRTLPLDITSQEQVLARFSDVLTPADHAAREDFLLYGAQGDTAQDLLRLLTPDQQALARARMAVRRGDPSASELIAALPAADQVSPGLVFERVIALRDRGDIAGALALIGYLPANLPDEHAAERLWKHGALVVAALQAGDAVSAYKIAARSGMTKGPDASAALFYAGWLALSRLHDPHQADEHFIKLQNSGVSPITQSRAFYWRGRAAEAEGDPVAAQLFYESAARYYTTFYGQLAAAKGGKTEITLGHDPVITEVVRRSFEGRDSIRAVRLFERMGNRDAAKTFILAMSDSLTDPADVAQLVDLAHEYGEQELSMRVVRNAARRGVILPERGYPIRQTPSGPESAEAPFVLSITRQESDFDPYAHSGAGARGMMQLMPATAQVIARRNGLGWGSLDDPEFNMKVGSVYLAQLVDQFSGSYVMAAAAYNAGPGRPTQWTNVCGDPRGSSTDPLDFIECIPFSETRDYVMRVLETTQVYRARLNGGVAPLTLAADLKRGAYGYAAYGPSTPAPTPVSLPLRQNPGGH